MVTYFGRPYIGERANNVRPFCSPKYQRPGERRAGVAYIRREKVRGLFTVRRVQKPLPSTALLLGGINQPIKRPLVN